jgi:hypothetical protein
VAGGAGRWLVFLGKQRSHGDLRNDGQHEVEDHRDHFVERAEQSSIITAVPGLQVYNNETGTVAEIRMLARMQGEVVGS